MRMLGAVTSKAKATDPMESNDVLRLPPPAAITHLRVVGANVEPFDITKLGDRFSIGRVRRPADPPARVEVQLLSTQVSLVHAEVTRHGSRLRVKDLSSTNGTYNDDGEEIVEADLAPGRIVRFADTRLLPLNEPQRALRIKLRWCMGLDAHAAVDEAMNEISRNRAVSLIGPPGCEQEDLAREIHMASPRRDLPFYVVPDAPTSYDQLVPMRGGTVFLDLDTVRTANLAAPFVRALLGLDRQRSPLYLRAVIAARQVRDIRSLVLTYTPLMLPSLTIPPLEQRKDEIPRMIDELLRRVGHRLTEVGPDAARVLSGRRWRRNLDELRDGARYLGAWLGASSGRAAAAAVGVSHETINKFLRGLVPTDE